MTNPRSIEEILGGVQSAKAEARARTEELEASAKEELQALQASIIAGNIAGLDPSRPWLDGVVGLYGQELVDSPKVIDRYEIVAAQLESALLMDPVVVIKRYGERSFWGGPGDPRNDERSLAIAMSVGILKGKELEFDLSAKEVSIPTSLHLEQAGRSRHTDTVISRNIKVDCVQSFMTSETECCLGLQLNRELASPLRGSPIELSPFEARPVLEMEIIAGRENIHNWLSADGEHDVGRNSYLNMMYRMSQKLGIKPIEPATEEQRRYLIF